MKGGGWKVGTSNEMHISLFRKRPGGHKGVRAGELASEARGERGAGESPQVGPRHTANSLLPGPHPRQPAEPNWISAARGQAEAQGIRGSVVMRLQAPDPAPGLQTPEPAAPCSTYPPSACPPGSTSSGDSTGTGSGDAGQSGSHGLTCGHAETRVSCDTHVLLPDPPCESSLDWRGHPKRGVGWVLMHERSPWEGAHIKTCTWELGFEG